MVVPYTDTPVSEGVWIREFNINSTDYSQYVWHRDREGRVITVLEGSGWSFQFDNELPNFININEVIEIPKLEYHRLIPGKTNLKIRIEEINEKF